MIVIHFNLDTRADSIYRYQGTGCVQFAYPEDAECAIQRINAENYSCGKRILKIKQADREFDVRRILLSPQHSRSPRISLAGDETVMDREEYNWCLAPKDWIGVA